MQTTITNPKQSLTASNASIWPHPHSHTQQFSQNALLLDNPMIAPTTAAASNLGDDDWPPCHSSSSLFQADNPEITTIVLQQWDDFYNTFIWLDTTILARNTDHSNTLMTAPATNANDTGDGSLQQPSSAMVTNH